MLKYFHTLIKRRKSMTKTKSFSLVAVLATMLCCVFLLAACGETQYRLSAVAGNTGGTVSESVMVNSGETGQITATPDSGYKFVGWYQTEDLSGNVYSTANPLEVTVEQDMTFYAKFELLAKYNLSLIADAGGFVSSVSGDYTEGSSIEISATADTGYYFVGWYTQANGAGELISAQSTYTIENLSGDITYYAHFEVLTSDVTAFVVGNVGGTVSGAGNVVYGEEITLTATPNDNYYFAGWYTTVDGSGAPIPKANATYTFTVTEPTVLYALFRVDPAFIIDRVLNGAYNTYNTFENGKDETNTALNAEASLFVNIEGVDLSINMGGIPITLHELPLQIDATASIDVVTKSNLITLSIDLMIQENTPLPIADIYYVENTETQMLYLDFTTLSTIVEGLPAKMAINMASLLAMIQDIDFPTASSTPWTLNSILAGLLEGTGFESLDIGALLQGFALDTSNNASDSMISINLSQILPLLGLLGNETLSQILDIFTGAYSDSVMPTIALDITAGFETQGSLEYLSSIGLGLSVNGDYNLKLGEETTITLPANSAITLRADSLSMGFGTPASAESISEITTAFADVEPINLLNTHIGADFNIYSGENGTTLDHAYKLEINTNIDPFAVLPAILLAQEGDTIADTLGRIDWENLGFLSIRIYDPEGVENDYLNILYDSTQSTQIYLYANFVNPISLFGMQLNLNGSYEISTFVQSLATTIQNIQDMNKTTTSTSLLALSNSNSTTTNESLNFNQIVVALIQVLASNNSTIMNDLSYNQEKGITLNLNNINLAINIAEMPIDFKNFLFGNGTQVSLKFTEFSYGTLNARNDQNEMVNNSTQSSYIDELFAESSVQYSAEDSSKMIKTINNIAELNNINYDEISSKINKAFSNIEVTYIDNTTQTITMQVKNTIINEQTREVTFVLYPARSCDASFLLVQSFGIDIPAGLSTYTTNYVTTATVQNTKDMSDEEILAIFSDHVLSDVKGDALHRTIVTADITGIDQSQVKWTLTDGDFVLNGDSPQGVYVDTDAPARPTVAAVMVGWAAEDFDKEWTVEFYVMNGNEKVIISNITFTPQTADYTKA